MSISIFWDIPVAIINTQNFDKVNIYKSTGENSDYSLLVQIDSKTAGAWVRSYTDISPDASRSLFYLIKFFDSVANVETQFYLTFFPLTPKELRLTSWLRGWLPSIMLQNTTDETLRVALTMAVHNFNVYPPETRFTIDNFPEEYLGLLIMQAQITFCMYSYIGIGIKDFSYGDQGLSLTIDRGEKIRSAMEDVLKVYNELLSISKLNFMSMGIGMGTTQLPVSGSICP